MASRLIRTGITSMQWTKPSFVDHRLGFEINLYIKHR